MEQSIKGNGKISCPMDLVLCIFQMVPFMKVFYSKALQILKVALLIQMESTIKVGSAKEWQMEKENSITTTKIILMKDSGYKISLMVLERKLGMMGRHSKDNLKEESKMEVEHIIKWEICPILGFFNQEKLLK